MQDSVNIILVNTTFPDEKSAHTISEKLIEEGLCACIHLHAPVTSLYIWEGKLEKEKEIPATFKLAPQKEKVFRSVFLTLHPYDIPQYYMTEASASDSYGKWISGGE